MKIQLPNDVVSKGCKRVGAFEFAQVFYSPSLNFIGSEKEFLETGYAYEYKDNGPYSRTILKQPTENKTC